MATIYVNVSASGSNNGSSWENAYNRLQDALNDNNLSAGDEIWVADGTYEPTVGNDRDASFVIPDDVKVYGGFTGGESSLSARNIEENVTILSGDIGTTDEISDNSYQVVTLNNVTRDTVLDGFTITEGNADNFRNDNDSGGGIFATDSSAIVSNLIITDNNARFGAGMYSGDSQHQLSNIQFLNNSSSDDGGGIYTSGSIDSFDNVTFGYNFSATEGGGIYNNRSTVDVVYSQFIANRANRDGGGIYNSFASSFSLSDSIFLNNSALSEGGGIYNNGGSSSSEYVVSSSIFKENVADVGAGIYNASTNEVKNTVTNSLFEDNYSRFGAGVYNYFSSAKIINSTFANNLSQFGSGVGSEGRDDDTPSITNSIFWDNLSIFGEDPIYNNGSVTGVSFSLVEGGFSGVDNLDEDPQFVDSDNFDYRLTSSSPALNAGTNDVINAEEDTDLAGNSRIADNTVDIGAYEGAELDPVPTEPQVAEDPTIIYVDRNATGDNDGTSWDNASTNLKTAIDNAPFGSQIWVARGTYRPSIDNRSASFKLKNTVAIYGGFAGGETSLSQRSINRNRTILSGELGDAADANDNSYHVVDASNVTTSAILDGFTIRGGNANEFGDNNNVGGGIYSVASQATLQNLVIEDNNAVDGGGIFINDNSSHLLTNVTFNRNSSTTEGGAVYNEGNTFFFDSEFNNNTAQEEGGAIYNERSNIYIEGTNFDSNRATRAGGAIYFNDFSTDTRQRIVNSVFNNNDSPFGGAIYNYFSDAEGVNLTFANNEAENGAAVYSEGREDETTPKYYNSIFWGNTGTSNTAQILNNDNGENTIVRNSIIEGGFSGQQNLDEDPQFVDEASADLRIKSGSPAINAGINDFVIEEQDFAGNTRVVGGTVDIGAYEFSEPYISIDDPVTTVGTTSGEPTADGAATFTIRLVDSAGQAAPQDGEVSIDYLTAGNTAVVGEDYTSTDGTITFAAGETEKTVDVPLRSNTTSEGEEQFFLNLSNATGGVLDFDSRGIATINSISNVVSVSINDVSTIEGTDDDTTVEFTVSLDEAAEQEVTVDYEVQESTATAESDYQDGGGTITFEPGETSKTISVTVLGDDEIEEEEQFFVKLTDSSNNAEFADARGTGTITDDDDPERPPTGGLLEELDTNINRFQNSDIPGTYLFAGEDESQGIRDNFDNFEEEGLAFKVAVEPGDNLIPLYRFQSTRTPGTYLFAGEEERRGINQNFAEEFNEEGLAFYVYGADSDVGTTFYRFQNEDRPGTYIFAGPDERQGILDNFPNFTEEGAAFNVGA